MGDCCHLEVARRLRQDAAVQGRSRHEQNVGLDQKDALHMRTLAHNDFTRDLPEDVLRKCAIRQVHLSVRVLQEAPRALNDEDIGFAFAKARAFEVDIISDADVCAEGVDAGRKFSGFAAEGAAEEACSKIDPRDIGVKAHRGVGVRALHVADSGGQIRWNGRRVVRRVGLASDLRCRRKISTQA